jgi:hypothetical protein
MPNAAAGVAVTKPSIADFSKPASATAWTASCDAISTTVTFPGFFVDGISENPVIAAVPLNDMDSSPDLFPQELFGNY